MTRSQTSTPVVNDNPFMKPMDWVSLALLVAVIFVVLPLLLDAFRLNLVGKYLTYSFVALGLVICWGFGGILSFGQAAFFGLGGYAYAVAAFNCADSTVPVLAAILVPTLFAGALGYFMFYGRISNVYVGVITLTVTLYQSPRISWIGFKMKNPIGMCIKDLIICDFFK